MKSLLSNPVGSLIKDWHNFSLATKNLCETLTENFPVDLSGLQGSSIAFFAANFIEETKKNALHAIQYTSTGRYSQGDSKSPLQKKISTSLDFVFIVPDEKEALSLTIDLKTAFEENVDIFTLPWWGTVPYRAANVGSVIFGQRAGVLSKLAFQERKVTSSTKPRIFLVTQRALQSPVPPPEYLRSLVFSLYKGEEIDPLKIAEKLSNLGYTKVPRVSLSGEFSLRGEVLDIYTPGNDFAYRVLFDFEKIETIKIFSPETQSTIGEADNLLVFPMKEVIWNRQLIEKLENAEDFSLHLKLTEEAQKAKDKLIENLKDFGQTEGEELLYPVLWEKIYTVLDYVDEETSVFYFDYDRQKNAQENFNREYSGMFRIARQTFPVLDVEQMLLDFDEVVSIHQKSIFFRTLHTSTEDETSEIIEKKDTKSPHKIHIPVNPGRSFFGNINYLKEEMASLIQNGWKILVFADNANQSLRIKEILKDFEISILPLAISQGFGIEETKTLVIQENEIFGRRKYVPKSLGHVKSQAIDTFVELNEGDFVVHANYGIAQFKGIQRVKAMGNERDYIKLEYADEEFVFVPIEQVNLVQRYIGNEGENPKLDKIGSKSWENRKNKVKKAVEDLAEKLIALYSRRQASRGFPFQKDNEWQTAFEASFPYEDTEDQYTVTKEIKADMEKPVPMDRLICGDVGFGKTEIAMRAAFKAVMGGKQVAFLAPTTILAEQHFETCIERFSNFPVKIAHMSRFVSQKEQKKILSELESGAVDILIGTHRIIQKDVKFKDLGLMIIDEEQRFGVKDKEKLKSLKANIDCLAMSATPIPRTLHMSLLKIRDMSLLTTPPQTRKPIETIVSEYTEEKVAKAIRQEVERGGQVFYLHNRVENLEEIRLKLQRLLPEMMIDIAHGQMSAEELDDIFRRFKLGGFHVLIATTIIENGIDIPNVNTIIIDRADMYGVSQLYQLRGRVGRSDRKAYAYLLYPEHKVLSEVAMKRLQVISDFTELGAGFKIAMKDMEIRGAGNLLGRDQSGDVYSVGFELYVKLLNEAVERLTSQKDYESQSEALIELEYTGFIPDSYVHSIQIKMEIYKKVATIQTKDELDRLFNELEDRFGPIPDEVYSLLSLAEVRIIAKKLSITTLKEHKGEIAVEFGRVADIPLDKLMRLIKENAGKIKLDSQKPNQIILSTGKIGLKEKSQFIKEKLETLL
ncbi:transcription-repair coupling factor [Treponema pectinovorum]|uniref:transcription-repair coupling factor n=1 Tax=Treponema pectinovorum TaxID=164 RepID=UPI0011CCDC88|nr:transcription-repair coupling factor [Treponema pectinovorum]